MKEHITDPPLSRYFVPDLPTAAEVYPFLEAIDRNRWYSNFGPLVREFETHVQALLSASDPNPSYGGIHLTTLVSGYHALEVALRVLGLPSDGCVLVPAITFGGCALAIQHAGLTAVLTDVDPISWTLTPQIARAAAARFEVSAVMPVALYGVPLPLDDWDAFAADTGIPVVIDAAAAAFEVQASPKRGFVMYSLHATKPFGIGEGGVLVSRDPLWIDSARRHSNFGMVERIVHHAGINGKMSEYHAAVGLAQLKRWQHIKEKRATLFSAYERQLKRFADLVSLQEAIHKAVVAMLVLRCREPMAARVVGRQRMDPIAFHRSYLPPLYHHPMFVDLPVVDTSGAYMAGSSALAQKNAHMQNCEQLARHLIGVPFHVFMGSEDVEVAVRELASDLMQPPLD